MTKNAMKIGFLTLGDPNRLRTWSGTPYFMAGALQEHVGDVCPLGPLHASGIRLLTACGKLVQLLSGRRLLPMQSRRAARLMGIDAGERIDAAKPDLVFLLAGSSAIEGVPKTLPLVYVSDATFRLIENYYPRYTRLTRKAARDADCLERASISRADLLLYPSDWAARSAIEDYGADPTKVAVVPFGANIDHVPTAEDPALRPTSGVCRLLFVGVDWAQKGAQIAVDTLDSLRARGIEAELTICGCTPPSPVRRPGLTIIRFLDKSNSDEMNRLTALYRTADFFILPTRAECYGIVYCEAAAYGLPSIGTATGGVAGAVRDGESGYLLPVKASGRDYAELISAIYRDGTRHIALRQSSRLAFEREFNWGAWGSRTSELIRAMHGRLPATRGG